MTIEINGVSFGKVTELRADRVTRRTDIRYNTKGDMLIDLVNRKYEVTAVFGLLTESELAALREQTQEIFVKVRFTAPEGEVCEDFHITEEPAPAVTSVNGVTMYGGVKLLMKQR